MSKTRSLTLEFVQVSRMAERLLDGLCGLAREPLLANILA